eukprot:scaffold91973_cov33-Phaeocystis_antarctica.AAC.2
MTEHTPSSYDHSRSTRHTTRLQKKTLSPVWRERALTARVSLQGGRLRGAEGRRMHHGLFIPRASPCSTASCRT